MSQPRDGRNEEIMEFFEGHRIGWSFYLHFIYLYKKQTNPKTSSCHFGGWIRKEGWACISLDLIPRFTRRMATGELNLNFFICKMGRVRIYLFLGR